MKTLHYGIGGWEGTLCMGPRPITTRADIDSARPLVTAGRPLKGKDICKRCKAIYLRQRAEDTQQESSMTKKTKTKKPAATKRAHTLAEFSLNPREYSALVTCSMLGRAKHGAGHEDIADAFRKGKAKAEDDFQANSWARNAVRRLIVESLVKRVGRGEFRATPRGRRYLELHDHGEWKVEH